MKKRVITGATGLVGSQLAQKWNQRNVPLVLVGRSISKLQETFSFEAEFCTWDDLRKRKNDDIELVVNLAGTSIGAGRWSKSLQNKILQSRLDATKACVKFINGNTSIKLMNASAVGIYGCYDGDHEAFTENNIEKRTAPCFLSTVCDQWEDEARTAIRQGVKVCLMRLGVVFDKNAEALQKMALPFRAFAGGPVGSGKQVVSWISLEDLVGAIDFLSESKEFGGPINLVAPNPLPQKLLAKKIGEVLHRPSFIPTPAIAIKIALGQMGEELVLKGQRASAEKLIKKGFTFQHTHAEDVLKLAL